MSETSVLIPPPPVVRDRLARHYREGRILQSLLKLSIRAAEERHRDPAVGAGFDGPLHIGTPLDAAGRC